MINHTKTLSLGLFLSGLAASGGGIALSVRSGMGATPMSVFSMMLVRIFPLSLGGLMLLLNIAFVLLEMLLLKDEFRKHQLLEFLAGPAIGLSVDLGLFLIPDLSTLPYAFRAFILLGGCGFMALGISLQLRGGLIMNPGEGLAWVIARKSGLKFSFVKIFMDLSFLLFAVIGSMLLFGDLQGLGEGTLILAFGTGFMVKGFLEALPRGRAYNRSTKEER